ncbi:MAG: arginine deiminase family protein [Gemmatimonadetes bacterium]|nr:arginine deiminase family protein [Gemmatimonadota bacterium]
MNAYGCQTMVRPLKRVLVMRPEQAYESQERIDAQWRSLDYLARPDYGRAVDEHRQFTALLEGAGAEVACLPADVRTGLDAMYTHDPVASVTDQGVILGRMGKDARMEEPDAQEDWYAGAGIPVAGRIEPPGSVEGGDVVWLKDDLVVIGLTYRTNGDGIRQFQELLQPRGIDVVAVPMVHWDGPGAVLHLMSVISLLDTDLAVVYERLLPIPFREMLVALGIGLVAVPDEEYDSLGCNVLAVGPRHVIVRSGNPVTVDRMRKAGCRVEEFNGDHICYAGSGGPTCLTRPILRA